MVGLVHTDRCLFPLYSPWKIQFDTCQSHPSAIHRTRVDTNGLCDYFREARCLTNSRQVNNVVECVGDLPQSFRQILQFGKGHEDVSVVIKERDLNLEEAVWLETSQNTKISDKTNTSTNNIYSARKGSMYKSLYKGGLTYTMYKYSVCSKIHTSKKVKVNSLLINESRNNFGRTRNKTVRDANPTY